MIKMKSSLLFLGGILIGLVIFYQMGYYVLSSFFGWNQAYNLIHVCQSVLEFYGFTPLKYFLDAFVLYTLGFAVFYMTKQVRKYLHFKRNMMMAVDQHATQSLSDNYRNEIIVFHCHEPLAFAMGMLRPKVYLSTALIDMLDEGEIDAVVYHELHHKYSYDPLKTFAFSMLTKVIWYIPVLKHMRQSYSVFREVIADDYAIQQTGTELGVGQALLKLIKNRTQFQKQTKFAVSFGDRALNLRIQKILNPTYNIPFNVPLIPIVTSTILMLVLMIMLNLNY
ncbi:MULTISPECIES: M56 family metallopeptidase [Bacillus]|uniref:M56 family metallopeptidase n=1 Tax=Bacillus TaxID=1386 RepID=UPI00071D89C0|nr:MULTISPECIES: M56 family metallopeptidase [Bacillus]KRV43448.1 peptidase M56 [Bacillus sp. TH007]MCY7688588.1 M56 family metallopeptidase [Bacillus altitudinis]MCY7703839.1 M56 family metallopeptidase [Bacillus altitudinis]MDH3110485.1 M56 family metallopeptidase [Bacillus altitudinis]MDN4637067.1 M56 family metallopeptidase [Bacillus sp. PsM16]